MLRCCMLCKNCHCRFKDSNKPKQDTNPHIHVHYNSGKQKFCVLCKNLVGISQCLDIFSSSFLCVSIVICMYVYVETLDRCQEYFFFFEVRPSHSTQSSLIQLSLTSQLVVGISCLCLLRKLQVRHHTHIKSMWILAILSSFLGSKLFNYLGSPSSPPCQTFVASHKAKAGGCYSQSCAVRCTGIQGNSVYNILMLFSTQYPIFLGSTD